MSGPDDIEDGTCHRIEIFSTHYDLKETNELRKDNEIKKMPFCVTRLTKKSRSVDII